MCSLRKSVVDIEHVLQAENLGVVAQVEGPSWGQLNQQSFWWCYGNGVIKLETLKNLNTQLVFPSSHLLNIEVEYIRMLQRDTEISEKWRRILFNLLAYRRQNLAKVVIFMYMPDENPGGAVNRLPIAAFPLVFTNSEHRTGPES